MWNNNGKTKTKMIVALALLVGVGVATYVAMGIDSNENTGGESLAVPNGDAGMSDDNADMETSKAEPKGVTEKTLPVSSGEVNETGDIGGSVSYGSMMASNASRGGTRMLFGGDVAVVPQSVDTAPQNESSDSAGVVETVQVVSVSSEGAVVQTELAVNKNGEILEPVQNEVESKAHSEVEKSENEIAAVQGGGESVAKAGIEEKASDPTEVDAAKTGDNTDEATNGEGAQPGDGTNLPADESEAEQQAQEEAERLAQEEAEKQAQEEAERKAREEAEKQAQEEAERAAREEAERIAREEAERLAREEEEKRKELENAGDVTYIPINDYPWQNVCPSQADTFLTTVNTPNGVQKLGGYVCECVSYAAWKVYINYGVLANWGNANTWDDNAMAMGYYLDHTPKAGAVGQTDDGYYGHVFWVEHVNKDGSIVISDYNDWQSTKAYSGNGHGWDYGLMTIPARYVSQYNYIHFR